MRSIRTLEEAGNIKLTHDELQRLRANKDLLDINGKVRDWHERKIITQLLQASDSGETERLKGVWRGFMYAFSLLEALAKEPERVVEEYEEFFSDHIF